MKPKYTHLDKEPLFQDLIYRYYDADNNKEDVAALHQYLESGDIDEFIKNGGNTVDGLTAFFFGGNFSINDGKLRLQKYIEDSRINPEKYMNAPYVRRSEANWELSAIREVGPQIFTLFGGFLSPDDFFEAFNWFYGDKFKPERTVSLSIFGENENYKIPTQANWIFVSVLSEIIEFLFPMDNKVLFDFSRAKHLYAYCCSVVPHISNEIYSKKLYAVRHELEDGSFSNYRVTQNGLRRMIASFNGIVSKNQIKKGFDQMIISDQNELEKFKELYDAIPWPKEYYELVDFVIESDSDYARASVE